MRRGDAQPSFSPRAGRTRGPAQSRRCPCTRRRTPAASARLAKLRHPSGPRRRRRAALSLRMGAGGQFSVGAMPRSHRVTPGRPWRPRATTSMKVSTIRPKEHGSARSRQGPSTTRRRKATREPSFSLKRGSAGASQAGPGNGMTRVAWLWHEKTPRDLPPLLTRSPTRARIRLRNHP